MPRNFRPKFRPILRPEFRPVIKICRRTPWHETNTQIIPQEYFPVFARGANTGATCIRPEIISLRNLAKMQKMTPLTYFPVFARVRIQALHAFAEKLIPQEFFPACIGFVPGGNSALGNVRRNRVGRFSSRAHKP